MTDENEIYLGRILQFDATLIGQVCSGSRILRNQQTIVHISKGYGCHVQQGSWQQGLCPSQFDT